MAGSFIEGRIFEKLIEYGSLSKWKTVPMTQTEWSEDNNPLVRIEKKQQKSNDNSCSLNDLLKKLRLLRIDCALLHNSVENSLLTGGICKKYTVRRKDPSETTIVFNGNVYKKTTKYVHPTSRRFRRILSAPSPLLSRRRAQPRPSSSRASSADHSSISTSSTVRTVQKRRKPWVPRTTVPEPFQMTVREASEPRRLTYSEKFVYKMLEEKLQREEQEKKERKKRFKAHPVPFTTYVPETNFYVGKLKRKSTQVAKVKGTRKNGVAKETSEKKKFHSTPIPLSTFIRPSTSAEDLRKLNRHQRAIELLTSASEPFGLEDHSIRWHVRNRIRHVPRCFQPKNGAMTTKRHIRSKSMPDFSKLHEKFREKLERAKSKPAATITQPFHFGKNNWTEEVDAEFKKLRKAFEDYKNK
ncbi:hypothetical protein Ddc_08675 [Ditylenchus destructor]|nr:hypothetical protein Ddc_08675 [Ditylenchus destructor]